ncbi:MAG: hypothetical protein U0Z44_07970 [Kouleothrix sp.]
MLAGCGGHERLIAVQLVGRHNDHRADVAARERRLDRRRCRRAVAARPGARVPPATATSWAPRTWRASASALRQRHLGRADHSNTDRAHEFSLGSLCVVAIFAFGKRYSTIKRVRFFRASREKIELKKIKCQCILPQAFACCHAGDRAGQPTYG